MTRPRVVHPSSQATPVQKQQSKSAELCTRGSMGTNLLRGPNGATHQQACHTSILVHREAAGSPRSPAKGQGTCGNSLTVTHTLAWLSKGPQFTGVSVEVRVHVKTAWAVDMSAPLAYHTSAPGKQQGARALAPKRGACPQTGGTWGGTGLAFLLKVLRYANPPFPPLRWGSQNAEPMIRWGPRDRFPLASKRRTGGTQSVSRP